MLTIELVCEQIKQALGEVRKEDALFKERVACLKLAGCKLVNAGQISDGDDPYKWEVTDWETDEVLASGGETVDMHAVWKDEWFSIDRVYDETTIEEPKVIDGLRDHESFAQVIMNWVLEDEEDACHFLVSAGQWEDRFLPC